MVVQPFNAAWLLLKGRMTEAQRRRMYGRNPKQFEPGSKSHRFNTLMNKTKMNTLSKFIEPHYRGGCGYDTP